MKRTRSRKATVVAPKAATGAIRRGGTSRRRAGAGAATGRARTGRNPGSESSTMVEVRAARDLFWQNVIRQILTSLSVEWLNRNQQAALPPGPNAAPAHGEASPPVAREDLFDGRLGILTHAGERIPIAQVFPVMACGMGATDASKLLSMAVECSVFQVRTPTGEVFTLPLSEMRGFHSLNPELMKSLEESARREADAEDKSSPEGPGAPFGFAAFTSMQRAMRERLHGTGYPQHPPDAPNPHPDE